MTAPTSGRDDATLRGAVVLVVAIVIGLALLARGGGGGDDDTAAETTTTTSTTEFDGATSETMAPINESSTSTPEEGGAREPSEVTVLVLNSTRIAGIAGENNDLLAQAGYSTLEPTNATTGELAETTIYARTEFQADAEAIKGLLALPDAVIAEKPEESLGGASDEADVVVVLGQDAGGEGEGGDGG